MGNLLNVISCILVLVVDIHTKENSSVFPGPTRPQVIMMPSNSGLPSNVSATGWRLIGTHHLTSALDTSGKNKVWVISMRDTIIYNSDGTINIRKSTYATSGWERQGLAWIDSSVYKGGILCESYFTAYERNAPGSWAYKNTYNQREDGKVHERYEYRWNSSWKDWEPFDKYIYYYSIPIKMDMTVNYKNFIKSDQFYYDTTDKDWKYNCSTSVVRSGNNDTTIVILKRQADIPGKVTYYERTIYTFKNSDMSYENRSTETLQKFDAQKGTLNNYSKKVYSDIGLDEYYFDSTGINFRKRYFYYELKDNHGNDTLVLEGNCEPFSICDTGSIDRYERLYDTFGNNIETLHRCRDYSTHEWSSNSRIVNFFEKIPTQANQKAEKSETPHIKIQKLANGILFSTPGITGINCFTISGRLAYTVKQNIPVSSFEFQFSNLKTGSNLYIVELLHCKGKTAVKVFNRNRND